MGNERSLAPHVAVIKIFVILTALLLSLGVPLKRAQAASAYVPNRSLQLSDSGASIANVEYRLGFTTLTAGSIGSIELEICDNDPFPGLPCTAPAGFDASSVTLLAQVGATGFSINPVSTSNRIVIGRAPAAVGAGLVVSYTFGNITNPNAERTYYGRIRTFSSNNGTGADTDEGGLAFSINGVFTISTEVPQVLDFCVAVNIVGSDCSGAGGSYIDFGILKETQTANATSQFMVATNAANGYSVTLSGTSLTAGNAVIPPLASQLPPLIGVSQFGFNLRQNTTPAVGSDPSGAGTAVVQANYNTPNLYRFKTGDLLVSAPNPSDYMKFTSSYIVNIDKNQHPGVYATTLSFIALASF